MALRRETEFCSIFAALILKKSFSGSRGRKFFWEFCCIFLKSFISDFQAYSGTLTRREIVRANASLSELRRDKEKLSSPISCEFVRVKAS